MKRFAVCALCLILLICLSATCVYARDELISVPAFRSLSQYESFVETANLPRDFVHISRLSLFGDFDYCRFEFLEYRYELSTGITIKIDHNTTGVAPGMTHQDHLPDGVTTMMKASNPDNMPFCYFRNGVYYIYNNEDLDTVAWFAGGILFQIPITKTDLGAYASIPVLVRLLSLSAEESDAAIAEICQSIGVRLQKTHFQIRNNRIQVLTQAVFLIPLPAFLIIRWIVIKRRKAKGIAIRQSRISQKNTPSVSTFVHHDSPFDPPNTH